MTELNTYLNDGANYQARAVLMFIQPKAQIEDSWNGTYYENVIQVGRWENCREQGYVLSLVNRKHSQLNIAFFEHRNSDNICAVKWSQRSMNSLNIETACFVDVYKDKYDVSHSVGWGQVLEMAEWIIDEFNKHWQAGKDDNGNELANEHKTIA